MTAILAEHYGTSLAGLRAYALNRVLRIYPTYWLALALGAGVLLWVPEAGVSLVRDFELPNSPQGWAANISLLGLDFATGAKIIHPAWTLTVEIIFYAIIPGIIMLGRRAAVAWLAASVVYHISLLDGRFGADAWVTWNARYGTVLAGSLGFAVGCCAYYYRHAFAARRVLALGCLLAVFGIFTALVYVAPPLEGRLFREPILGSMPVVGFYAAIALAAPAVAWLAQLTPASVGKTSFRIDNALGRLSYPLYLVHYPIGLAAFHGFGLERGPASSTLIGIAANLIVALLLCLFERKIDRVRTRVRASVEAQPCSLQPTQSDDLEAHPASAKT